MNKLTCYKKILKHRKSRTLGMPVSERFIPKGFYPQLKYYGSEIEILGDLIKIEIEIRFQLGYYIFGE